MSNNISSGRMEFNLSFGNAPQPASHKDPEAPFRILVLGDFSGRQNRGVQEAPGTRKPWKIDCDNFENIPGRMEAGLKIPSTSQPGESFAIRIASLDDFHPDRLLKQVKPLARLLDGRARLLKPATANEAAAELEGLLKASGHPRSSETPAQPAESNDDTLSRLLGKTGEPQSAPKPSITSGGVDVQSLIRNIIDASPAPTPNPHQATMVSAVDAELATGLRAILHHPDFQALESAWRSADLMVRNFGGEEQIQIFLLNLSKAELAADLQGADDLGQSGFFRMLRTTEEGEPWGMLLGHYGFGPTLEDFDLLGRLAKISAALKVPFIAAADSQLAGCSSFAEQPDPMDWRQQWGAESNEAWAALRAMPEASYLGLALPRFLLRQPYGPDSDPIESFPFVEIAGGNPHESFLWGYSSTLVAFNFAETFQSEGWEMSPSGFAEIGDLPVYRFSSEGETRVKPCAEAWLSERAGEALEEKGFIPVLSVKGRDAVRLGNLRAVKVGSDVLALG